MSCYAEEEGDFLRNYPTSCYHFIHHPMKIPAFIVIILSSNVNKKQTNLKNIFDKRRFGEIF